MVGVAVGWRPGRGGTAIGVLRAGGAGWSVVTAPRGVGSLSSVACPTSSTCYAGGFLSPPAPGGTLPVRRFPGAMVATADAGHHWRIVPLPAAAGPVNAVSCAGPSACVAAGVSADASARLTAGAAGPPGMALSTIDGGRHWQVDVLPRSASGIAGVSCVAAAVAPSCDATAAGPASSSLVLAGVNAG